MQLATEVLQEAQKHHIEGRLAEAEKLYCSLIAHEEKHPAAYQGLGALYAQAYCPGRAIVMLKKAIEIDPKDHNAMMNLGAVYRQLEDRESAFDWYAKSLELNRNAQILANLAGMHINDGTPQKALEWAEQALEINPAMPQALNHKALALLEMGRFVEGFAVYDGRMDVAGFKKRPYECPMWDGKPVRHLALHGEQGLGDEILFLTLLPQVFKMLPDSKVAVEVNPRLVKLVQNSYPGAYVYGSHEELITNFTPDAYLPLGSLPRIVGFGSPFSEKPVAYLKPVDICERSGLRIGLSWRGGAVSTHAKLRNTVPRYWKAFTELGECVSLQYGEAQEDAEIIGIPHPAESIANLDRLAAIIKSCDLVISVCNTTIHMAGALGVPCLVLVPSKPAWRYGLEGERMAWYEFVKMIRQRDGEPWIAVLARAKQEAKEFIADIRELQTPKRIAAPLES